MFLINSHVLLLPPIGLESHLKRNGIPLRIFPVRNARRYLPIQLILHSEFSGGRVHHRFGRAPLPPWDSFVLKARRGQRVFLDIMHFYDPLLGPRIIPGYLVRGGIFYVFAVIRFQFFYFLLVGCCGLCFHKRGIY